MDFCPVCENMLSTRLSSEDGEALTLYCHRCATTQPGSVTSGPVSSTLIRQQLQKPEYVAGEATASDPTLPVADSIACPACAQAGRADSQVVYVRYDSTVIKFLYMCTACHHRWNVENLSS